MSWKMCFGIARKQRKPRQENPVPAGYQQELPRGGNGSNGTFVMSYGGGGGGGNNSSSGGAGGGGGSSSSFVVVENCFISPPINQRGSVRWVASTEQQALWDGSQVFTKIIPPLEIEKETPVERREHPELELDPEKKEIPPVPAFDRKIDFEDK